MANGKLVQQTGLCVRKKFFNFRNMPEELCFCAVCITYVHAYLEDADWLDGCLYVATQNASERGQVDKECATIPLHAACWQGTQPL